LLREAREVSVQVRAPSQNVYVDAILAATVGTRAWGPVELTTLGSGKRWIAVRYRSGLLRALLTVLYAAIQGRASRIIRG
jgi:phosphate starvation-inducible protein PhoH